MAATYVVTGKNPSGEPIVSVTISGIDQETQVVQDIDVVNAVRAFLAGTAGVNSVVAQRYEQVITVI
ncbi:hypothetical protein [Streptomyces sp. AK02-04a]|uniref:hypothetical protein n=1 Tax=Streptomyces sp. AK02-04a TaxID=3028649 RepID=UPI0029B0A6BC|nr:hypothetical protein [Streptomyces sp. AK02-04a]MDX3759354.1 hypothetical protein [Streptomyces sp. AK02-04a]